MHGVGDRVHFLGFTDDIVSVWANHHALALPSRSEGLPLAVVEAMLCGRMCIVTDVSGNAELIENNGTGFIAKAPTPDLLDEAMERAWQRRSEWQEMGARAARAIRVHVSADPIGEFIAILRSAK
jgi:glycosyltransferase involved in cell wall biosynthesis